MDKEANRGESKKEGENTPWWQPALVLFGKFSGWILAPLFLGIFLGQWLDKKFNTAPWILLAATIISFVISIIGLIMTALKDIKRLENKDKK
jgi:F0F1-type ATP synthase assembly protein I